MREILDHGRDQTTTVDGNEPNALERIRASRPDLLIIDLRLGGRMKCGESGKTCDLCLTAA